jgi:hypothetical protein
MAMYLTANPNKMTPLKTIINETKQAQTPMAQSRAFIKQPSATTFLQMIKHLPNELEENPEMQHKILEAMTTVLADNTKTQDPAKIALYLTLTSEKLKEVLNMENLNAQGFKAYFTENNKLFPEISALLIPVAGLDEKTAEERIEAVEPALAKSILPQRTKEMIKLVLVMIVSAPPVSTPPGHSGPTQSEEPARLAQPSKVDHTRDSESPTSVTEGPATSPK